MKKVLSLVLAVVMVLGLTTMAMASPSIGTATDANTPNLNASNNSGARDKVSLRIFAVNTTGTGSVDFAMDEHQLKDPITHEMASNGREGKQFENIPVGSNDSEKFSTESTTGLFVAFRHENDPANEWRWLDRTNSNRWNVTASLSSSRVFRGINVQRNYNGSSLTAINGISEMVRLRFDLVNSLSTAGTVGSKDTIRVHLDGRGGSQSDSFTLEAELRHKQSSQLWAYDFDSDNHFYINKFNDAKVLRVMEFVQRAKVFLPAEMILSTNLFQRNYLLDVTTHISGTNQDIMDAYRFDDAVFFNHSNLPDSATVTFDLGENFWVYGFAPGTGYDGAALIELGRSNQNLPVTNAYFFSSRQLQLATPVEPPAEGPTAPPETGPVDTGSTGGSTNFNPGTGL